MIGHHHYAVLESAQVAFKWREFAGVVVVDGVVGVIFIIFIHVIGAVLVLVPILFERLLRTSFQANLRDHQRRAHS